MKADVRVWRFCDVTDVDAAIAFYTEMLGFTPISNPAPVLPEFRAGNCTCC